MNKEKFFIRHIANGAVIGDDGAVIDGMVYSQDAFFENVHFKRSWMSYEQIAYKAMMVNISDAVVMNARPLYALLTVAMPPDMSYDDIRSLQRGFKKAARKYNIAIIGGDTIQNVKLDLSVTIVSATDAPVYRTGLRPGDMIAYTGRLGRTKRDLETLLAGGSVPATSRFIRPVLREAFFYRAAPLIRSALDISDGLFSELERLSEANRCGFDFVRFVPPEIGCSGEEYEILLGFAPENETAIRAVAAATRTPLTVVGRVVRGSFTSPCRAHHFGGQP